MQHSFDNQIGRLLAAGFPELLVVAVAESILQRVKNRAGAERAETQRWMARPVAMPYMHQVSHNLKKVANRHRIPVVFTAPNKLSRLCPRICGDRKGGCQTSHDSRFVGCATGVVYSVPLLCGKVYIGQTERCINDRLREHALKVKKKEDKYAHLVAHIITCGCEARFYETTILGKSTNYTARVALEAFYIHKNSDICISEASILLHSAELNYLNSVA